MFGHKRNRLSREEIKLIQDGIKKLDRVLTIERFSLNASHNLVDLLREIYNYLADLYNICFHIPDSAFPDSMRDEWHNIRGDLWKAINEGKIDHALYTLSKNYPRSEEMLLMVNSKLARVALDHLKDKILKVQLGETYNSLLMLYSAHEKRLKLLKEEDIDLLSNQISKLKKTIEYIKKLRKRFSSLIKSSNYKESKFYKKTKIDLDKIAPALKSAEDNVERFIELVNIEIKLYKKINRDEVLIKKLVEEHERMVKEAKEKKGKEKVYYAYDVRP